MPTIIEGTFKSVGTIAIVVSRFNEFITYKLLDGALDCLTRNGFDVEKSVTIVKVPGAFEIPLVAKKLADSGKYDGIVCLGAVIKGATAHFDYVSSEATKGISAAMLDSGVPIAFGVLTTDTIEQAIERSGTKLGNKGFEVTQNLIEMVNLLAKL
ncbi:6,7-dimethyl-8-ribityllumazine synthase [bacterium]|jgi:6,7-dimethyl-8-ribityllumazine synthase|nr:6,7-dimethyl-8-ribityllumazine synthase [bacterium]